MSAESINMQKLASHFEKVRRILEKSPTIDKFKMIGRQEFLSRAEKTYGELARQGIEVGLVFSDEHYCGDVPYLGGNTNVTVEQVAGIIGKTGFHLLAGLEGGYVAEQLSSRSGAKVHKLELLQLAMKSIRCKPSGWRMFSPRRTAASCRKGSPC